MGIQEGGISGHRQDITGFIFVYYVTLYIKHCLHMEGEGGGGEEKVYKFYLTMFLERLLSFCIPFYLWRLKFFLF